MLNKVIIGLLIFMLVLTGILGAHSYSLVRRIDALNEQLAVSQTEQARQTNALSEQLTASQTKQESQINALSERLTASQAQQESRVSALSDELASFKEESLVAGRETLARIVTVDDQLKGVASELEQTVINASKLYPEISKGVVRISDGQRVIGTGFAYGTNPYIITPQHVVNGQGEINVILSDGRVSSAAVVGASEFSDVAVLKPEQGLTIDSSPFADSNTIRVGEPVIAIGNPFDLPGTITYGIVSQLNRYSEVQQDSTTRWIANLIQFDAAVNYGNSGSPLFNSEGEVIGMVIARVDPTDGDGVYYAVSSNKIKRVAQSLIEHGSFDYPWLGVEIVGLTPDEVRARNLETANGALVKGIIAGSPAETSGIKVDDVILAIDETAIRNVADLISYLGEYKSPGETARIELIRGGTEMELPLQIGKR